MSMRALCVWVGLFAVLQGVLGCSFDDGVNDAHGCDEQCVNCYLGYCLLTLEEAATASGGFGGGSGSAGSSGSAGNSGSGATGGGGGTIGSGGSSGGGGVSATGGMGGGGGTGMTGGTGAGGSPACDPAMPAPETCNGLDEDCDGKVDEATSSSCYPAGTEGCIANADGSFACTGLCAEGTQTCVGGVLSACAGVITPAAELCGGAEAADENCNGSVDDTCPCAGNETQRCYDGPAGTAGVGLCRAGTQTCEGGRFGACEGAIVPAAETCTNPGADDNCNGRRDDVPNRGALCFDPGNQGACLFGFGECRGGVVVCVTPEPAATETACDSVDEDCDGRIDETFMLATDEQNCGACGTRCAAGQQCCGGTCRSIASDAAHCGGCNMACDAGSACCAGSCFALNTDTHCGACNVACGANQDCCGASCVNIDTSAHCGACNIVCGDAQSCCGGACVTPGMDNMHCGACNITCPEACPCSAGECRDSMGLACL